MTAIAAVHAWEALDSRGRPTVGCRVELAGGASGRAIVPSGASTGGHEARELRDGDPARYGGYGAQAAVKSVQANLTPVVLGREAEDQAGVDAVLESADPDPLLATVGANAVLAVSLATMLAAADASGWPLWKYLAEDGAEPSLPMPMVNIISGGAHAGRALDIQDVLVIPVGAPTFAEAISWASRVRAAAADLLARRSVPVALVADEGGLAGGLESNEGALALVTDSITHAGLVPGEQAMLAVDIAANQIFSDGRYRLTLDGDDLDPDGWLARVDRWCQDYPIISLEDVLAEDDWDGWRRATSALGDGRQLVGDDLFATNAERLERGIAMGVANAVLVKPNQAGTVSRAGHVVKRARSAGYATIVSARSGDTEDTWLADLAVGWNAGQIKVGSTMRSERTAKWNRLLEIESRTNARLAQFPDRLSRPRG